MGLRLALLLLELGRVDDAAAAVGQALAAASRDGRPGVGVLVLGATNLRALDLSPHTVKRHVANILDKLVLQSRGQAAAWYRAHGAQAAE